MYRRTVTVALKDGLHLRPLSQIAQLASGYDCDLKITKGDLTVDAKSALDLMQLNADHGATLTIAGCGERAREAVDGIVRLFEREFLD